MTDALPVVPDEHHEHPTSAATRTAMRVAVLGGDRREARVAVRLSKNGHTVNHFGTDLVSAQDVRVTESAEEAVAGARWIVCPAPGLGPDDSVFAPYATTPIVLDQRLLSHSDVHAGGIILGRASPSLRTWAAKSGCRLFETKDDPRLAEIVADAVAEELVAQMVRLTDRLLREVPVALLGFGATGRAIAKLLVSIGEPVWVAARRPEVLREALALGAQQAVPYDRRAELFKDAGLIVNTAPDRRAISPDAFAAVGSTAVIDISSPPGGIDHDAASAAGLTVIWARGLGGKRAPVTVGDAQFEFARRIIEEEP